jgi:hypothetical protein
MNSGVQVFGVQGLDPEILVRGFLDERFVSLRYAPQRDVTPWELATLLQLVVAAQAYPSRDWVGWIARHGLLRHFEAT